MDINLIFKIAAIGIIVAVLNQLLIRAGREERMARFGPRVAEIYVYALKCAGREEQALMTTLAGLIVVLFMLIQQISVLFDTVKSVFGL